MFPGINPAMIKFMITAQLDEIVAGKVPDSFELKEKTENKIVLSLKEENKMDGVVLNRLDLSFNYKGKEIILVDPGYQKQLS